MLLNKMVTLKYLVGYFLFFWVVVNGFIVDPIVDPALVTNASTSVSIDCGKVRGLYSADSDAFMFRGIPYASPPVGDLRWRPPVDVNSTNNNCWSGEFEATVFGNQCFQIVFGNETQNVTGSEDCLYINVWTPTLNDTAKLPVMFWIHGGSLIVGNGIDEENGYAPTAKLAKAHNVVYVSVHYRLNAFGFLALEQLKAVSPTKTTGNYGLMDLLSGLRWVQNNIEHFGGDRNQV